MSKLWNMANYKIYSIIFEAILWQLPWTMPCRPTAAHASQDDKCLSVFRSAANNFAFSWYFVPQSNLDAILKNNSRPWVNCARRFSKINQEETVHLSLHNHNSEIKRNSLLTTLTHGYWVAIHPVSFEGILPSTNRCTGFWNTMSKKLPNIFSHLQSNETSIATGFSRTARFFSRVKHGSTQLTTFCDFLKGIGSSWYLWLNFETISSIFKDIPILQALWKATNWFVSVWGFEWQCVKVKECTLFTRVHTHNLHQMISKLNAPTTASPSAFQLRRRFLLNGCRKHIFCSSVRAMFSRKTSRGRVTPFLLHFAIHSDLVSTKSFHALHTRRRLNTKSFPGTNSRMCSNSSPGKSSSGNGVRDPDAPIVQSTKSRLFWSETQKITKPWNRWNKEPSHREVISPVSIHFSLPPPTHTKLHSDASRARKRRLFYFIFFSFILFFLFALLTNRTTGCWLNGIYHLPHKWATHSDAPSIWIPVFICSVYPGTHWQLQGTTSIL